MTEISDWTERHRPSSESHLEGNESQRKKIREWLDDWKKGVPKKRAILLIGPPGVGKTSVARAVAQDMGWNVIELNASDDRNAAAIRKAATQGATHRSLFHDPSEKPKRTIILLDEVDHLSGGLRAVSNDRLNKQMLGEFEDGNATLSGDTGGKAELLNLLKTTKQPVILACNEAMGLWGKSSSWRSTKERFQSHLTIINFVRASDEALRNIARRVLKSEQVEYDLDAVDALIANNPGDLRALVRDLQVLCSTKSDKLDYKTVIDFLSASERDVSVEIFPGLEKLYKSKSATEAMKLGIAIDKTPMELINWIHWNNASLFSDKKSIERGNQALSVSSKMLSAMFENTAHRSWYWSGQLSNLAASVANQKDMPDRIYPRYPDFLRSQFSRSNATLIDRLSEISGMSKSAVREEFMPLLTALHSDDQPLGESNHFDISLSLGLTAEEHANICGMPLNRKSTKDLISRYNLIQSEIESPKEEIIDIPTAGEEESTEMMEETPKRDTGQSTLF